MPDRARNIMPDRPRNITPVRPRNPFFQSLAFLGEGHDRIAARIGEFEGAMITSLKDIADSIKAGSSRGPRPVVVYLYFGVGRKGSFNNLLQGAFLKRASEKNNLLRLDEDVTMEDFVQKGMATAGHPDFSDLPTIEEEDLRQFHALALPVWKLLQSQNEEGPPPGGDSGDAS